MKSVYRFGIVAATVAIVFVLWGCINPFQSNKGGTSGAGVPGTTTVGSLTIGTSTGITAQTITPGTDLKSLVSSYRVEFTDHDGGEADFAVDPYTEGETIDNIPLGSWTITVVGRDAGGHDIAIAVPDSGNPVYVYPSLSITTTLQPIASSTGTGTLLWNLTFPATDVDSAVITVDPWPIGGGDETVLSQGTEYTADFASGSLAINTTLNSGEYFITIEFSKTVGAGTEDHPPVSEIVRIYDYLTSSETTALTTADFTQPPPAPTGLTATSISTSEIELSWNDVSNTESGFEVERSLDGTNGWTAVSTDPYPLVAGSTGFIDSGLSHSTPYYYRVRSLNEFGPSETWATVNATTDTVYTVTYYPNGAASGGVPVDSASYESGETITVLDNTGGLTKGSTPERTFVYWCTTADGTGDTFAPGDSTSPTDTDIELYAIYLGDRGPAGGYLFYDKGSISDGWRYLEISPSSLTGAPWAPSPWSTVDLNGDYATAVPELTTIGAGQANTAFVVATFGDTLQSSDYACGVATAYDGGGFDDWFLPSRDEMAEIYTHLAAPGLGNIDPWVHLSSSEGLADKAWYYYLGAPESTSVIDKALSRDIRAIRAFRGRGDASYVVTYHPNGSESGSAPFDLTLYESGEEVTVKPNNSGGDALSKTDFSFVGWNTKPDGSGTHYGSAETLSMPAGGAVLYAEWQASVVYAIGGDGPAGGKVFYDKGSYSNGWRYLEGAVSNVGGSTTYPWGGYGTSSGGTGTAIGTGAENTAVIVEAYGDTEPYENTGNYAARVCDQYEYGGYSDWFLPSKDELNELYVNRTRFTPYLDSLYWSSSEADSDDAWLQNVTSGYQEPNQKSFNLEVRAVRRF